jgi:hypothetical protein
MVENMAYLEPNMTNQCVYKVIVNHIIYSQSYSIIYLSFMDFFIKTVFFN